MQIILATWNKTKVHWLTKGFSSSGLKIRPLDKNGIEDVAELAYTVAEHHPYWGLLYNCTQIGKTALDKWNDNLSKEELDEIDWSIDELKNTLKKLKEDLSKQ